MEEHLSHHLLFVEHGLGVSYSLLQAAYQSIGSDHIQYFSLRVLANILVSSSWMSSAEWMSSVEWMSRWVSWMSSVEWVSRWVNLKMNEEMEEWVCMSEGEWVNTNTGILGTNIREILLLCLHKSSVCVYLWTTAAALTSTSWTPESQRDRWDSFYQCTGSGPKSCSIGFRTKPPVQTRDLKAQAGFLSNCTACRSHFSSLHLHCPTSLWQFPVSHLYLESGSVLHLFDKESCYSTDAQLIGNPGIE